MKNIIINAIIAIIALAAVYVLILNDMAFVSQLNGFVWFGGIVISFIVFGISMAKIISYLDPEEEV